MSICVIIVVTHHYIQLLYTAVEPLYSVYWTMEQLEMLVLEMS